MGGKQIFSGGTLVNWENINDEKYRKRQIRTGWLLLLVFCVGLTTSLIGFIMGRIVSLDHYSGHMVDTIILSSREHEEQGQDTRISNIINLAGRVLYTDGTPYANGRVELRSQPRYTQTDSLGQFIFKDVEPGEHIISIIQNGIIIASSEVIVEKGEHYTESQIVRLDNGDYLVLLSLDVVQIELFLVIEESGELAISINTGPPFDMEGSSPPDDEGLPPDQDAPLDPDATPDPDASVDPGTPVDPLPPQPPDIPGSVGPPNRPPIVEAREKADDSRTWSQATSINIFGRRENSIGNNNLNGLNSGEPDHGVIAPGDSGIYPFLLKNIESYPIKYTISLSDTDESLPKIPLKYRLKMSDSYVGNDQWQSAEEIQSDIKVLAPGSIDYYTLEWKWITESDALDTMIGRQSESGFYILSILINAQFN